MNCYDAILMHDQRELYTINSNQISEFSSDNYLCIGPTNL
jgi:hypothetical protein